MTKRGSLMDDPNMNAYMDQYEDIPKLSLLEWLQERYSNCLLIAGEKVGRDREGWLEDAYYIRLLIQRESATHDRLPVPNSITGNLLDHWEMLPGDVRQDLKDTGTGFLEDKQTMPRANFFARYQEYLGLSDAALDAQTGELIALRRVVISERAQVIYYSDKYLAFLAHECVDVVAVNFLDLDESVQEPYVKRAIEELSEARGVVPHDRESVAKKVVFPN